MGDPSYITDLNALIGDLNNLKLNNPHTDEIYSNIVKDFNNTMKDIRLSRSLDDIDELLRLSDASDKENENENDKTKSIVTIKKDTNDKLLFYKRLWSSFVSPF